MRRRPVQSRGQEERPGDGGGGGGGARVGRVQQRVVVRERRRPAEMYRYNKKQREIYNVIVATSF